MRQQAAWNRGDLKAFVADYWQDDALTFASARGITRGHASLLSMYQKSYPNAEVMGQLRFELLDFRPLGRGSVLILGAYHLQRKEPAHGFFSVIFQRTAQGLKIIHDHSSATPEPQKPAPSTAIAATAKGRAHSPYKVGDQVANFSLPRLSDNQLTDLQQLAKGKKYLVLDFWSIQCPYCVGSEASFQNLHKKFSPQGVSFVHINANRTENSTPEQLARVKATVQNKDIAFPVLLDKGNTIADAFGAPVTPTVFILRCKDMQVIYHGAPNDNPSQPDEVSKDYIDQALSEALAGKEIQIKTTDPKG